MSLCFTLFSCVYRVCVIAPRACATADQVSQGRRVKIVRGIAFCSRCPIRHHPLSHLHALHYDRYVHTTQSGATTGATATASASIWRWPHASSTTSACSRQPRTLCGTRTACVDVCVTRGTLATIAAFGARAVVLCCVTRRHVLVLLMP